MVELLICCSLFKGHEDSGWIGKKVDVNCTYLVDGILFH